MRKVNDARRLSLSSMQKIILPFVSGFLALLFFHESTLALLHGNVRAALNFHPLVFLLAPLFIGFVGSAALELLRDPAKPRPPPRVRWNGR